MNQTPTKEITFSMAYNAKAMSLVEVKLFSLCRLQFNEISNNELRRCELSFFDEERDKSQVKLAAY